MENKLFTIVHYNMHILRRQQVLPDLQHDAKITDPTKGLAALQDAKAHLEV